jgi:hypothetical protein
MIAVKVNYNQNAQKTGREAVDRIPALPKIPVWTAQQERNARFLVLRDIIDLKRWLHEPPAQRSLWDSWPS